MNKYDIIVAGGGFAGVCAAVAAARLGKRTLLIEKEGSLGGAAVSSLVLPFMGYHTTVTDDSGNKTDLDLVRGIFAEIVAKLNALDGTGRHLFSTDRLKLVLDELVTASGCDVLFDSMIVDVNKSGRRIDGVCVYSLGRKYTFEADCFIDATGDANLAALAGCEFWLGRDSDRLCQPMTLCFRVSGVPTKLLFERRDEMQKVYAEQKKSGLLRNEREDLLYFTTIDPNVTHFNSTRVIKLDPTDPFALSKAEIEGRKQMFELFELLRNNFDFCRDMKLVSSGSQIGVRESRMVKGEHRLTGDELVRTVKFPDAIAVGNYDIDIHNPTGSGTSHYFFKPGEFYTIPYSSIVAKDSDNLLVAGRCISCDHEAQASIRIMPICAAVGQAAGTAAAVLTEQKVAAREADTEKIRKCLLSADAFLG